MATVKAERKATTFVLELSETEAQYVESALRQSACNNAGGGDPTWDALSDAMEEAGVAFDPTAAISRS